MNCQHDMCLCRVDAVEEACSDHCRQMVGEADHNGACGCGHDACTGAGA
ncbi:MAG TPA: hypothetical protein VJ913_11850 [Actinomycetota bacterium]|nr:hypothetical protein [Actinomycetota bacterium]